MSISATDANEVAVIERSNELSEIIAKYKNSLNNNRVSSNQPTINKGENKKLMQSQKSVNIASPK